MASKLGPHSQVASATGPVDIPFTAAPVGGFNVIAALDTATSASVELHVRIGSDWLLADTLTLDGLNPSDNIAVFVAYEAARWNITAISGGQIKLEALGVGV